jgi:hypothetical protein
MNDKEHMPSTEERLHELENQVAAIQERLAELPAGPSKELVKRYEGQRVRVFLASGAIVSGDAHFDGNWVDVPNALSRKSALCNLGHAVSITKDE